MADLKGDIATVRGGMCGPMSIGDQGVKDVKAALDRLAVAVDGLVHLEEAARLLYLETTVPADGHPPQNHPNPQHWRDVADWLKAERTRKAAAELVKTGGETK